jgi:hypothetical protein
VNDEANTSPVEITPGANIVAVSLCVYTGGGSAGGALRERAHPALARRMAATELR